MDPTAFTPFSSLLGGVLIGVAAVLMMATTGRVAGVGGFVSRLLPPYEDGELLPRLAFVAGLVLAPVLYMVVSVARVAHVVSSNLLLRLQVCWLARVLSLAAAVRAAMVSAGWLGCPGARWRRQ